MSLQTFQKNAWHDLFTHTIFSVFAENNFEYQDVQVYFEPENASAFLKTPVNSNGSCIQTLNAKIIFAHKETSATIVKPLITLPVLNNGGLVIKNTKWCLINTTSPASGWYLRYDHNRKPQLTLNRNASKVISIGYVNNVISVSFASSRPGRSKENISLMEFLKALSFDPTMQYSDIMELLEDCNIVATAYLAEQKRMQNKGIKEPTTSEAATKLLNILSGRHEDTAWPDPIAELQKRLADNFLRIGDERIPRFKRFSSFSCALQDGVIAAADIHTATVDIPKGGALTEDAVRSLDADDSITQIVVSYGKNVYTLKKFVPTRAITFDEVCFMLHVYDRFCSGLGKANDPDEYDNKIIKSIREYYEEYIDRALYKYVLGIKKLLNAGVTDDVIEYIVQEDFAKYATPLEDTIDKINKNNFYQQLDDTNSLSIFEQEYKLTTTAKNVSNTARDIHPMQYGRVCPYTTPESKQVGLNLSLALMSSVDAYGFITTPLLPFTKGKLSTTPVYLSAIDEIGKIIAPSTVDLEEEWKQHSDDAEYMIPDCRVDGAVKAAFLSSITHQEVSKTQSIGPLIATVPSAERNAGKRLIMSAAAQRQALPTWKPERPLVTTGVEALVDMGVVTARTLIEDHLTSSGIKHDLVGNERLYFVKSRKLSEALEVTFSFQYEGQNYAIKRVLPAPTSTIKGALKYMRCASPENKDELQRYYNLDDTVFYNNDVDLSRARFSKDKINFNSCKFDANSIADHGVAIGANVKILFKSFAGYNYEDSIVVNEDFLVRQGLTVIRTATLKIILQQNQTVAFDETVLGHQPQLNEHGYPIQGYYVQAGQPILAIATTNGNTVKYSAETLKTGQSGFIMSCTKTPDHGKTIIRVALGEILPVAIGDKLEGLHGNKGVVGRIAPANEMPYTEDGEVPDIILNTLGIVARLNLGQMVEFTLGAIAEKTGEIQIIEPFAEESVEEITALARQYGLVEKDIYDGRTGLKFEKKAMLGDMYMLRLTHTNTSKFNATSNCQDNINARTMQPAKGPGGGQRMSELCTWCLMSYDADATLSTLFTAQSDDLECKQKLDRAIRHQDDTDIPITSSNIEMLQAYFYMLGVNIAIGNSTRLELLTQKFIDVIAPKKCMITTPAGQAQTPQQILHDPSLYSSGASTESDRKTLAQLPFYCEMIMPIFLHNGGVLGMVAYAIEEDGGVSYNLKKLTDQALKRLLAGNYYISGWDKRQVDPVFAERIKDDYSIALPEFYEVPVFATRGVGLNNPETWGIHGVVELFKRYNVLSSISQPGFENAERIILFAKNYQLSDFIVTSMIIPPPGYRQVSRRDKKMSNPIDARLVEVVGAVKNVAASTSALDRVQWENRLYATLESITLKDVDVDNPSLRKQLSVHSTKASIMRDTLLAKRLSYSGRSVITIGPELEFGQCGAPISMLTKIFDEHIVAELGNSQGHYFLHILAEYMHCDGRSFYRKAINFLSNNNIEGFRNLCIQGQNTILTDAWADIAAEYNKYHPDSPVKVSNVLQLFDTCYQELKDLLKKLLKAHPAALNREPSLHKFSVQGMDVIVVDSYALQLHPLNCHGYNADYDGDQMSLTVPMHKRGIEDMRNKMMSENNMIDPKDGSGIASLNQDMILGLYYATIHKDNVVCYTTTPEIAATYYLPDFTGFDEPKGKTYGVADQIATDVFLGLINLHDTIRCYYSNRIYVAEAGRFLVNSLLPNAQGFTEALEVPEKGIYALKIDYVLTKKTIDRITSDLIDYFFEYDLGADETGDTLAAAYNRFMCLGFKMADLSGITLSIYDFTNLPVKALTSNLGQKATEASAAMDYWYNRGFFTDEAHTEAKIAMWSSTTKQMKSLLENEFKQGNTFDRNSNIFMIVDSGARGDIYQLLEMAGIIGVVTNSTGESLETPILTSYMDGLSPTSFLLNAYTSRRQTVTAQLSTADAGEFSRKCIYLNDHIVIRPDDKRCDGKSLWIDMRYDAQPSDNVSDKILVLEDDDIDAIPDEVLMQAPTFLCDTDLARANYREFCKKVRHLVEAPIFDENTSHLLRMHMQTYFFAKNKLGQYSCIEVSFTLSKQSKRMLKYRVMDMQAISEDPICKGYAILFKRHAARVAGAIPNSLAEDIVIDDAILHDIETACLPKIPIYTIIGCHSTEGICRCCFGVKYDTHKFPNFGEHVGYQAVQAIGNPITQMILDSHKSEYSNEESAKDKLDRILNSDSAAAVANIDIRPSLPFATEDGLILKLEKIETGYIASLTNEGGKVVQAVPISNLLNLNFCEGTKLPKGAKLTKISTDLYNNWLYYAPAEMVQLDVWEALCDCFNNENILSRNFEVFARSLTEFGVAKTTDISKGIVKGSIYSLDRLRSSGIPFSAAFESQAHTLMRGDKVLAGVAFADPVKNICDAVVRGVENNAHSNVGVMLLGTYKTLAYPRYTHSVIDERYTTPTSVDVYLPESQPETETGPKYSPPSPPTPSPTTTPSLTDVDPVAQQILSQIAQLEERDTYSSDASIEVATSGAESTSFFKED